MERLKQVVLNSMCAWLYGRWVDCREARTTACVHGCRGDGSTAGKHAQQPVCMAVGAMGRLQGSTHNSMCAWLYGRWVDCREARTTACVHGCRGDGASAGKHAQQRVCTSGSGGGSKPAVHSSMCVGAATAAASRASQQLELGTCSSPGDPARPGAGPVPTLPPLPPSSCPPLPMGGWMAMRYAHCVLTGRLLRCRRAGRARPVPKACQQGGRRGCCGAGQEAQRGPAGGRSRDHR
eukprot:363215-Chlamydomonas_euryale.AAC.4